MNIPHAIRLVRETCVLRHFSFKTEKTYVHWLRRYGAFLKEAPVTALPTEKKIEAFLTHLAISGITGSTQNQAFNALLFFYRDVLKRELGPVDALRAKRPGALRQCASLEEVRQLLAAVSDSWDSSCPLRRCNP